MNTDQKGGGVSGPLLTVQEFAAFVKVTPGVVYKWIRSDRIPVVRLGRGLRGRVRLDREAVLRALAPREAQDDRNRGMVGTMNGEAT